MRGGRRGDVASLVRRASEAAGAGRPNLAIDGRVLGCIRQTLAPHGITPSRHIELWRPGVRKRQHEDFSAAEAGSVLAHCRTIAEEARQ